MKVSATLDSMSHTAQDRRQHLRASLLLLSVGVALVTLFVLNTVISRQHRFVHNYQVGETLGTLRIFAALFTVFLVALWFGARAAARIPPRVALSIVLLVFGAVSLAAIVISPTRSQDLRWNLLLAKGFSHYGMNPYETPGRALEDDLWAPPEMAWRDHPMTHGPIWVLLIGLITGCTYSLKVALILVKLTAAIALGIGGILLWRIMKLHGRTAGESAGVLALLAWNPFVLQTALVDAHNDVLILVAILASYLFFLTRKYALSAVALMIGGFVKYVTWPLMLLPLAYLVKERGLRRAGPTLILLALLWVALAGVLYAPFGFSARNFTGFTEYIMKYGWAAFYWPGAAVLGSLPGMDVPRVRLTGIVLACVALGMCIRRDRPLLGYTLPFALMLFFGTPSFHPWYGLWVAPLGALLVAPSALLIVSVPLIADELASRWLIWMVTLGLLAVLGMVRLLRTRSSPRRAC